MRTVIQEIPQNTEGRLIAVSDIHGYAHYLKGLLDKIGFARNDTLVIIGDLIEKGPASLETVRFILGLIDGHYRVHVSMGNVEYTRVAHLIDESPEADEDFFQELRTAKFNWKHGLFLDMMEELGIDFDGITRENAAGLKRQLYDAYRREIDWLRQLPTVLVMGNFIFAHGGVPAESIAKLRETDAFECLKRREFLREPVKFEKYVAVGHWPVCLYRDDIDSMNPIYDAEKHIVSIDGGCALKTGAQLNALVLPPMAADMSGAAFEAYDDFPVITAEEDQQWRSPTVHFRYFDCEVEILEEAGDMVRLRHLTTGRIFWAPRSYLFFRENKPPMCDDYSDAFLEIQKGDRLSLIRNTSMGLIVKKDGEIGWYRRGKDRERT